MNPEAEIRRRIALAGAITFAEFMDVALYWPDGGYYSAITTTTTPARGGATPFGAQGDYYTAPQAHPAFGALLAVQLYQFWLLLDRPNPFHVVEPGSGNGQLSRDILSAAHGLPEAFSHALRYLCLDRNPRPATPGQPAAHAIATDGLPLRGLRGCVLSNELIDALPVHQVRVVDGRLREVFVTLERDNDPEESPLVETLADPSTPALAARLEELRISLAEGQTAEICLELDSWSAAVASALDQGFVLTIDYGRLADDLYSAQLRPRGTLVTYHRHTQTDAPLRRIGQQDITAQVDFTALVNSGRRAGLEPLGYTTQAGFLRNLDLDRLRRRVTSCPLPVEEGVANRAGLLALARPDGLGDFKVLAQGRNLPAGSDASPQLWGLSPSPEVRPLVAALPLPLLSPDHISLPSGWPQPPVQEFDLTDLWNNPFTADA
ncbi:MAG: SAM-dependent methyltransferase [Chloroflexi bacterium]|nr:SAM-dependent methyltransferase [Chloroflexota bacterium]